MQHDLFFYAISILIFALAMTTHGMIIRMPGKKEPPIVIAARRLRVGGYLVIVVPSLYHVTAFNVADVLSSSHYYFIVSMLLISISDIFVGMARLFGLFDLIGQPVNPNVFPITKSTSEEAAYVPIFPTDRRPD